MRAIAYIMFDYNAENNARICHRSPIFPFNLNETLYFAVDPHYYSSNPHHQLKSTFVSNKHFLQCYHLNFLFPSSKQALSNIILHGFGVNSCTLVTACLSSSATDGAIAGGVQ